MECKYTCFDRVIYLIRKIPEENIKEACSVIQNLTFEDFLDFCVENNCFTKEQKSTIHDFIIMWENLDGNYFEEDEQRLIRLYEAVGITKDIFLNNLEN